MVLKTLFNIRSIIALILTLTFAVLAFMKVITEGEFITIFTAVIVYFFVDNKGGKQK